jgi:acid phosphatase (class A)
MQFDLNKMSSRYFNNLKLRAVYVDVPINAFKIGNFPANSSLRTQKEIEFLKTLADTARNEDKIDECNYFADVYYRNLVVKGDSDYVAMRKNLFHMGRQLGEWFSPDSLPNTANLMAKVWQDASYYIWALKFKYNRIRPYNLDKDLKNISDPNFPAYPSGHSSSSYVAAFIYSQLLPDYETLFINNAYAMAYSREILGVHFPSDSEAGKVFARQFVNLLLQSNDFKKDFVLAKKEIQKVIKTKEIPTAFKDKKPCKVPINNCDPSKCSN